MQTLQKDTSDTLLVLKLNVTLDYINSHLCANKRPGSMHWRATCYIRGARMHKYMGVVSFGSSALTWKLTSNEVSALKVFIFKFVHEL